MLAAASASVSVEMLRAANSAMAGSRVIAALHNSRNVTECRIRARLAEEAHALARQLAEGPTRAYGVVKALLAETFQTAYEAQLEHEARGIAAMAGTPDGQEGIRAFVEKRAPRFTGA